MKAITPPRYSAQFKIGKVLLAMIDRRRKPGVSRNRWMEEAVVSYLEKGEATPCKLTAEWLLAEKETVMIRLDPLLLSLVDEQCDEKQIPRTVWLMDACLSKIAGKGK